MKLIDKWNCFYLLMKYFGLKGKNRLFLWPTWYQQESFCKTVGYVLATLVCCNLYVFEIIIYKMMVCTECSCRSIFIGIQNWQELSNFKLTFSIDTLKCAVNGNVRILSVDKFDV